MRRGDERAVVTGCHRNVIVRNPQRIDWSDPEIVRVARGERDEYPGLVKSGPFVGGIDHGRVAFRVR